MAKPTMAIFTHHPQCELDCAFAMAKIFSRDYIVKIITIAELNHHTLGKTDILAFPGGIGDADDFDNIFTHDHVTLVRAWIAKGGRYLGICMGAYWAGKHYFNLLGEADAVQYITTPDCEIVTEFETIADVNVLGTPEKMYFYDGCAFVNHNQNHEVLAIYKNGLPMALHDGRVLVIGCHPESQKWWHKDIGNYNKNAKHYLREFTNLLFE